MREIFNSHPVSVLKKEISKTNIKGYSKMKKSQIVDLMMKNKERFKHIKMAEKKSRVQEKKAPEPKPAPAKKKKIKFNVIKRLPPKAKTPSPPKEKTPSPPQVKLTPKQEEQKKKVLKERKDEPFMFDMWDDDVQELWEETGRSFKKLPKRLEDGRVLYYHDFFNTDGSTTLSKRKTSNYNIPTYVNPNNGYSVGKNRWRDYSWD